MPFDFSASACIQLPRQESERLIDTPSFNLSPDDEANLNRIFLKKRRYFYIIKYVIYLLDNRSLPAKSTIKINFNDLLSKKTKRKTKCPIKHLPKLIVEDLVVSSFCLSRRSRKYLRERLIINHLLINF